MIYLNEEYMEVEELFREKAFVKRGDAYYFVAEEIEEDTYLCVKLFNELSNDRFEMEAVEVYVNWENRDEIVDEVEVGTKKEIEHAFHELFYLLSYAENVQSVMMFEGILELVKEYFNESYFYNEGKKIIGEFMELFEISGVLNEGNYSGTIKLTDVVFKNKMTENIIVEFNDIFLEGMIDAKDDDEFEYLLQAYAESMSPYEIEQILAQALE